VCHRLPFWKLLANVDSGPRVERELRTFSNRLRRHQLGEGVISLNEHSTTLLSDMVRAHHGASPDQQPQTTLANWVIFQRETRSGGPQPVQPQRGRDKESEL